MNQIISLCESCKMPEQIKECRDRDKTIPMGACCFYVKKVEEK